VSTSRDASSGARAALPELRKTSGSMVFTASVAGLNSGGGGVLYTASKHAVVGLIRELAVELAPDVRVNGVAPGGTMTDLRGLASLGEDDRSQFANPGIEDRLRAGNPLRTVLTPDDLAGAYVFLASRRNARGITGSVDGRCRRDAADAEADRARELRQPEGCGGELSRFGDLLAQNGCGKYHTGRLGFGRTA